MVERHNRTIENMLSLWTNTYQDDWDQHLSLLAMAYRSAPHDSTAETPNMLNFGRELLLPVDLVLDALPDETREPNFSQYAADLQDRLQTAHDAARAYMSSRMQVQKRQYDLNVRPTTYQEGDVVWLHHVQRRKGKSPKLMRPWKGPFVIITKLSEVVFRIQQSPRSKPQVVHADRLKPCVGVRAGELGFGRWVTDEPGSPQVQEAAPLPLVAPGPDLTSETTEPSWRRPCLPLLPAPLGPDEAA